MLYMYVGDIFERFGHQNPSSQILNRLNFDISIISVVFSHLFFALVLTFV